MQLPTTNLSTPPLDSITRRLPLSFDIGMSIVYMLLIVLGVFSNFATIAAFLLIVLVFYTLPLENIVSQTLFLVAFASIFKLGPSSTSLMTVIQLYIVVLMLWRKYPFKAKEMLLLATLFVSVLLGVLFSSNLQVLLAIKFIAGMLMFMGFKYTDYQKELPNYIIMFILGLIISSAIAYFGSDVSQLTQYITIDRVVESTWQGSRFTETFRFSGLNADPNYYSINLCISIVGVLVLDNKGAFKNSLWVFLGAAALLFFGVHTISKSFALMAIVVAFYLFFVIIKNKKFGLLILLLLIVATFTAIIVSRSVGVVNTLVDRVLESLDGGDITTGRANIWGRYFSYLAYHPRLILFGAGFGYGFGGLPAAHNTYVECITCLGIVGTLLFVALLFTLFSKENQVFKRSLENYSVILIIVVMYFFLSMLTWIDMPIHLFLCFCFLNYKADENKMLVSNKRRKFK